MRKWPRHLCLVSVDRFRGAPHLCSFPVLGGGGGAHPTDCKIEKETGLPSFK